MTYAIYTYYKQNSADPPGLRVDHPPCFWITFVPNLFRIFFPSESMILLTLRAWGEVYLPPSPLLGHGPAGSISPWSPPGSIFSYFSGFWTHFFRFPKPSKKRPVPKKPKTKKIDPRAPQAPIINEMSCFSTSIFGSKNIILWEPPKPCFLTTVQRFSMILPLKGWPFWHQKLRLLNAFLRTLREPIF